MKSSDRNIGGNDQDHVGAAEAQAAGHGIRGVTGDRDRLVDLQPRRFCNLSGVWIARDTVAIDTSAILATSSMVAGVESDTALCLASPYRMSP